MINRRLWLNQILIATQILDDHLIIQLIWWSSISRINIYHNLLNYSSLYTNFFHLTLWRRTVSLITMTTISFAIFNLLYLSPTPHQSSVRFAVSFVINRVEYGKGSKEWIVRQAFQIRGVRQAIVKNDRITWIINLIKSLQGTGWLLRSTANREQATTVTLLVNQHSTPSYYISSNSPHISNPWRPTTHSDWPIPL